MSSGEIQYTLARGKPGLESAIRGAAASKTSSRLMCFPYAGAGASVFADWTRYFPAWMELLALTLPGREARFADEPVESVAAASEDVGRRLTPLLDRPFTFLGHSLGGLVAFETARWLRRHKLRSPNY